MGLVEDQRVVAQQPPVALDLGEQDAVGHQLDQGAVADLVGESDRVADGLAERGSQLVGDALRHRAGGQPPGLGVPDGAADAAAEFQADLGQLSGLARPGFAGDDDHLVRQYRRADFLPSLTDRQVGVGDRLDSGLPCSDHCFGCSDLVGEPPQLLRTRAAEVLQSPAQACAVADGQAVQAAAQLRPRCFDGRFGHAGQDKACAPVAAGARFLSRRR